MSDKNPSRREFVETAAKSALAAAFVPTGFPMIVPRHVLGGPGFRAPSDTLNFAVVGFGGMGSGNAEVLAQAENMVAVCDVDLLFSDKNVTDKEKNRDGSPKATGLKLREQFNKAAKYRDFREMLDKQKDIDAVVVATPDHNHAVVAKAAIQLGKHVYVQKPLTTSVHEARALAQMARDNPKIVTQMGNQGHSMDGTRSVVEWIRAGVIGPVHEVHVWTNRPIWPQGISRPIAPAQIPPGQALSNGWNARNINNAAAAAMSAGGTPMPEGMRWDLYLGGTAEDVPYHPVYHPFNWRGWTDFGVGALGDMGAHLIDQPYWALELTQPVSIEATSTPWGTTPIPPDDPQRKLTLARPDEDKKLPHISVAGDTYTILVSGADTAGRYCLIDMHVPPGGGPPPHRHDFEEMFTILEGEIEVTFRGAKSVGRAGETVNIPANAPHFFKNASDRPARLLCLCSPAGQEEFFRLIGDRVESRTAPPPKLSEAERAERMAKADALAPKYRTEILRP